MEKAVEKILKIISANHKISAKNIAVLLRLSSRAIEKQLEKLKKQGKLKPNMTKQRRALGSP